MRLPKSDEGAFVDGKRHGRGVFYYHDGIVYRGAFKDGLKHGRGRVVLPDGRTFRNTWSAWADGEETAERVWGGSLEDNGEEEEEDEEDDEETRDVATVAEEEGDMELVEIEIPMEKRLFNSD